MTMRHSLGGEELLLRRYDPRNASHTVVDEGTSQRRLSSGAFRFDSEDDLPGRLGCSVYRDPELERLGLTRGAVIEQPGWQLAGVQVDEVRTVTRSGTEFPFDAIADPNPFGANLHPREGAHALITIPSDTSGMAKWYSALARKFQLVSLDRKAVE